MKWIEEPVAPAVPLFLLSLNPFDGAFCISKSLKLLFECLWRAVTEFEFLIRDGGKLSPLDKYYLGISKLCALFAEL